MFHQHWKDNNAKMVFIPVHFIILYSEAWYEEMYSFNFLLVRS